MQTFFFAGDKRPAFGFGNVGAEEFVAVKGVAVFVIEFVNGIIGSFFADLKGIFCILARFGSFGKFEMRAGEIGFGTAVDADTIF